MPRKLLLLMLLSSLLMLPLTAASDNLEEAYHLAQSRVHMKAGDYPAAIEAYEQYLATRPDSHEALKGIAIAYEMLGEIDQAIRRYDLYLQAFPDDAQTAFKQADYLSADAYASRRRDAIGYLQMGLKVEDDFKQRIKYARLLAEDGQDPEEAVQQYEILLQQMSDNQTIQREYRTLLLTDRRFLDKAISEYQSLVAEDPSNSADRRQLAQLLAQSEPRRQQAAELYASLVQQQPDDPDLRLEYARLLAGSDSTLQSAQREYRWLIEQKPDYPVLAEAAAVMARDSATRDEAIDLYSHMLEQRPRDVEARLARAAIYRQQEAGSELALRDYRQVIRQDRKNTVARRGAATVLAHQDQPEQALYQPRLALKSTAEDEGSDQLTEQLTRVSERRLTPLFSIIKQNGGDFAYDARNYGLEFSADYSPFMTFSATLGYEQAKNDSFDASDDWWRIAGKYRFVSKRRLEFEISRHAIRDNGNPLTASLLFIDNSQQKTSWNYRLGYQIVAVKDSLLSWLGDDNLGLDPASRQQFTADLEQRDPQQRRSLNMAIGIVDSGTRDDNSFLRVGASLAWPAQSLEFLGGWSIQDADTWIGIDTSLQTYEQDQSGFSSASDEPLPGGYFSPHNLAELWLFADITGAAQDDSQWRAIIGPRLQYIDDAEGNDAELSLAGSLTLTQATPAGNRVQLKLEHNATGDRYRRTTLTGQWVYFFE